MAKFHIGIRVDEIVDIGPSDSKEFPTEYVLRNGHRRITTGAWQENAKAIERLLAEDEAVRMRREDVQDRLDSEIRMAEARLASLRAVETAHRPAVDDPDLAIVAEYVTSGRTYLRKDEREALCRLIGAEEPSE